MEAYLIKAVAAARGKYRKLRWVGRRDAPDRLILLPRLGPILVELKRPGKKPTETQAREHALLRRFKVRVEVIDSTLGVDYLIAEEQRL